MIEQARQAIASYPFDDVWPFTNIFWLDSPATFVAPVIGIAGSYKNVESVWSEWLWKFSQLLTLLEAVEARVTLEARSPIKFGEFHWRLLPQAILNFPRTPLPNSLVGQQWGIVEAPENDFSIDPEWLAIVESSLGHVDERTGEIHWYSWDKFVPRWLPEPDT